MNSLRRLGVLALLALPCADPSAFAQTAPTVSGVTIGSSPPRQSTYMRGETIRVAVTFTAAVTVTGSPRLALTIGSARSRLWDAGMAGERSPSGGRTVGAGVDAELGWGVGAFRGFGTADALLPVRAGAGG